MSTIRTNTLSNVAGTASTAIENAINGSAKAWVNFNGTGTVAIRAAYNVSSITDLGVGSYQVNLTTAMPDTNYCVNASSGTFTPDTVGVSATTSNFRVDNCDARTYGRTDTSLMQVSVFR